MYKKQIIPAKTSGSVIKHKKKTKTCNSAKSTGSSKHKNESAELTMRVEDKGKYLVNSDIHFHPDVPEQVQEFIKRISSDSKPNEKKIENTEQDRLPRACDDTDWSEDVSSCLSRKSSVQVIVTTEFTPNCLTNSDYDKLKEVKEVFN